MSMSIGRLLLRSMNGIRAINGRPPQLNEEIFMKAWKGLSCGKKIDDVVTHMFYGNERSVPYNVAKAYSRISFNERMAVELLEAAKRGEALRKARGWDRS